MLRCRKNLGTGLGFMTIWDFSEPSLRRARPRGAATGHLALLAIAAFAVASCGETEPAPSRAAALAPVQAFYKAFDDGFTAPASFATEDWNHINPG